MLVVGVGEGVVVDGVRRCTVGHIRIHQFTHMNDLLEN